MSVRSAMAVSNMAVVRTMGDDVNWQQNRLQEAVMVWEAISRYGGCYFGRKRLLLFYHSAVVGNFGTGWTV